MGQFWDVTLYGSREATASDHTALEPPTIVTRASPLGHKQQASVSVQTVQVQSSIVKWVAILPLL